MRFALSVFAGAIRQLDPRLLPDEVGVDSLNQNPTRGDLRAWKQTNTVASVPSGRKTIYRMGRDVASDSDYWLSWTGTVNPVRGFIASDTTERTYYTGDGAPKVADNTISLASAPYPTTARDLGVPKPAQPVTLTQATPGTGDDELRYYTQTYVTDRGEESAPSATASITCKPGAIINITNLQQPPAGNYGITLRRIYRTQASTVGAAFFFLLEVAVDSVSTQDDARAVGADTLATTGWEMPPSDLKQLTGMWNGMMAGISGRAIRVCEPYKPYAWPIGYEIVPPDVTPVALGVWSKNLLVLTNGRPYLINGSSPDALGDDPIEFDQSCISDRSVVDVGHGVVWASPDGLAYFGAGGPKMLTAGLMNRADWQAIKPETITGAQYEGAYMGFYEPTPGTLLGFLIDPTAPRGIYFLDKGYSAAFFDKLRDSLYVLDGTSIKKWDAAAGSMTATFKSKVFRSPRPVNMGYLEVIADTYPVTVKVYAGGALTETRTVPSQDPVTLKAGFMATDWQLEVSVSGGGVQGVAFAQSIDELKQV